MKKDEKKHHVLYYLYSLYTYITYNFCDAG